jgi:protocatechuate 3,4-dioxygenase alpha subunit
VLLEPTPSQTVGPFFSIGLSRDASSRHLVEPGTPGSIRIHGRVLDGAGNPVNDSVLEIWQPDPEGLYRTPASDGFTSFGRCGTNDAGEFEFVTLKPGVPSSADGRSQAPHVDVQVFSRGLLKQLRTRIYFPDEVEANAADPLLAAISDPEERATLIARSEGDSLRWDVQLQGEGQTVFLAIV